MKGNKAFEKHEKRDAIYSVASYIVRNNWGNASRIADGLGILLLVWNQAFYRYGGFDFLRLELWLGKHKKILSKLRKRNILSFSPADEKPTKELFNSLLAALKARGMKSPVAVAKTLHVLAPDFFPLWDNKIAKAYGCHWGKSNVAATKYSAFIYINVAIAKQVKRSFRKRKTLLKLIDEYNYSKYTRGWI